jgi:hypothetical protein
MLNVPSLIPALSMVIMLMIFYHGKLIFTPSKIKEAEDAQDKSRAFFIL